MNLILGEGLERQGKEDGVIALIVQFAIRIGQSQLPRIQVPVNRVLLKQEMAGGGLKLFLAFELPVFVDPVKEIERRLVAVAEDRAVTNIVVAD